MKKQLILMALMALLCTGCSSTEVRDRSFVKAIGVSGTKAQTVTVSPFGDAPACTGTGDSLFGALDEAEAQQEKRLFLGHAELFLTGSGPLRTRLCDLFANGNVSPGCKLLLVSDKALAEQTAASPLAVLTSMQRKGKLLVPTCAEVLDALLGREEKALLPCLFKGEYRMAVMDADGRVHGVLSEDACEGVCWLSGLSEPRTLSVSADGESVDFSLRHVRKKTEVAIEENSVRFHLTLTLLGNAMQTCEPEALESALQARIAACSRAAVSEAVSACGADILGISKAVEREDPAFYAAHESDWDEILRAAEMTCTVRVRPSL